MRGTGITSLPKKLTIGRFIDFDGSPCMILIPDGLTVTGSIGSLKRDIRKIHALKNGEYVTGQYLYADGILTHVRGSRKIGGYTFYIGKIKGRNVVSDGVHYAHCDKLRDGVADIAFKTAKSRGAEQYKGLSLDTVVSLDDAVTMYRIITGACRQGSQDFVDSLGDNRKDAYTIRECIELTRGQYNAEAFERFFDGGRKGRE